MIMKIVEYNSSTYKYIEVSCVNALKAFEPTQVAIDTLTDTPYNIAPEAR